MCLMSSWIGHGQWQHPFVQLSTLSTRLAFPGASTFPGARVPHRPDSGSRLLWLPCLALLGRVTHRSGVPCFDRKPFRGRKMQGGGKGKGKGGNPAVLTSQIKEAETAAEVLRLLDGAVDGPIFNHIHASAACPSLADFHEDRKLQAADAKSPVIQRLASRIEILIKAKGVGPRQLANALTIGDVTETSSTFFQRVRRREHLVRSHEVNLKTWRPRKLCGLRSGGIQPSKMPGAQISPAKFGHL